MDKFNIKYSANQKKGVNKLIDNSSEEPAGGYLKMKFDYREIYFLGQLFHSFFQIMVMTGTNWFQSYKWCSH
ncbi:MAG: hypothetical protein Ct9H90mP17_3580 [Actinomycetota bacterium]|nr:MAG: hypothetical protein Ct9H90mP17_3580 [Actinomycetota bacterium]